VRELVWGLVAVSREVRGWRARAAGIPDPQLREDALAALLRKRGHTDGAALLWTVPRVREPRLLALLVTYELIWDFLDGVNERGAALGQANGRQLHLALLDALAPDRPLVPYYRHHPWQRDGGYLRALVAVCRERCRALPRYGEVRSLLAEEAVRAQALAINHDLDPARRDAGLRAWAARERQGAAEATWFELTGAASASLTVHALLALSAEPAWRGARPAPTRAAYYPWISTATTMLDSWVDQAEDRANGDHSYVAHYASIDRAAARIRALIERSLREARALPDGERHVVVVACMAAMYLSKDSARTPAMRGSTRDLAHAGGSLTRLLLPVLRLWRVLNAQRPH
jgi:tetraprenyl-beta-curcumene synthase